MADKIYLDYAAATPVSQAVMTVMKPYFSDAFYNPSADYLSARLVKQQLNLARSKIAFWLGCRLNEIIFTAGGTEANNLVINGIMANYPGSRILISSIEHDSVSKPAQKYHSQEITIKSDGRLDLDNLTAAIDDQTVLISVMYANNEIGVIEPIRKVAQLISIVKQQRSARGITLPLWLHTDACQAANYLDLHVSRLGVDLMTLNGGKIYGPKQSGVLYVKSGISIQPLIDGGGQEYNLRSGTENVAADIGLAEALDISQSLRQTESIRLTTIRDYFIQQLEASFPAVKINGSRQYRLPNNVHASFKDQDNEAILIKLDQLGIMAAAGSACSAAKEEASHVLLALGLSDIEAHSSIRFSLGRATNQSHIDQVIAGLKQILGV